MGGAYLHHFVLNFWDYLTQGASHTILFTLFIEIVTTCFNVDLNRSASEKKLCSKMSIFKPCQKTFPPLVNDNEQGPYGGRGGREKLMTFLLRGKMIFCYRVNRFLTVSLLSQIFT